MEAPKLEWQALLYTFISPSSQKMRFFTNLSGPCFFFLLLISCSTLAWAARFDITNNCPYTVWAAAVPGGGCQLGHGQTWTLVIPAGTTAGRIWARTECQFDSSGKGSCKTGDCGGLLQCQAYGVSPNTLAEFSLNQYMNQDFVDMSLIEGFNVPMEFSSTSGACNLVIEGFNVPMEFSLTSGGCNLMLKCTADIIGQCPAALTVPGGCNGPCPIFKTDEYCCNAGSCEPTDYSRYLKNRCPDAYSYPKDDTATKACPGGTNYKVVFCP
ncbi:hypothetical protein BT93_E0327 [Corymbia citriodora subsp. variegata]|nr:hypothetical protein BT93_E0327 [Corymbia citriodora subsp. variegata]